MHKIELRRAYFRNLCSEIGTIEMYFLWVFKPPTQWSGNETSMLHDHVQPPLGTTVMTWYFCILSFLLQLRSAKKCCVNDQSHEIGERLLVYQWISYSQTEAYNLSWQFLFWLCIRVHPCAHPHEYFVVESSLSPGVLREEDKEFRSQGTVADQTVQGLGDPEHQKRGVAYHVALYTTKNTKWPFP